MMLELFPDGFEEREEEDDVELVAYTDWSGEERLWQVFGGARSSPVADDWAERWRTFHRPVRVGPLWIGPPWLEAPGDAVAVVIEPGRAFGTGAHPTTRLCIELLLDVERGSLLDVGSGSGAIAIAAAKLGFEPVTAFDVDPAAVEAGLENAAANGVTVHVALCDALAPETELPRADVTVANIALEPLLALAERVRSRVLIASGYTAGEDPRPEGFRRLERRVVEGWAADVFARQ